jgi:hypothetical protein
MLCRRLWLAVLLAFGALAACGEGAKSRACVERGPARLCAIRDGAGFHLEGRGLRPGSVVTASLVRGGIDPVPFEGRVGANGEYPDEAVAGFVLGQAKSASWRISAVTSTGETIPSVFTLTRYSVKVEPDSDP